MYINKFFLEKINLLIKFRKRKLEKKNNLNIK